MTPFYQNLSKWFPKFSLMPGKSRLSAPSLALGLACVLLANCTPLPETLPIPPDVEEHTDIEEEVTDLESSISGHLSGEDEATELSGQLVDDYAWVDKNWQKTGWRNPEAAKWKARQNPDGFAKERRAYEAGWRAAERMKTGAVKLGSDKRACENWGEIVSKWTIVEHKRTCGGSAP